MSIASEITRLQGAKAAIKAAIEAKGVSVPSETTLDGYATKIAEISDEDDFYTELCDETFGTTYTVTFNSNGGTEIDDEEVYTGQTATEPTAPTKSGCEFCGWYSDSGLESAYIFTSAVTSDITLYAKWTASAA